MTRVNEDIVPDGYLGGLVLDQQFEPTNKPRMDFDSLQDWASLLGVDPEEGGLSEEWVEVTESRVWELFRESTCQNVTDLEYRPHKLNYRIYNACLCWPCYRAQFAVTVSLTRVSRQYVGLSSLNVRVPFM